MADVVRRGDRGLGKTAAGGNTGSFAPYEREAAAAPPVDGRFRSREEFLYALNMLDGELNSLNIPDPIKIRALGGFAMIMHGLRGDGYTADIDTATADYRRDVQAVIAQVGDELAVERDWINNQVSAGDPRQVQEMLDAVYIAQDFGFRNIDLAVADLPTLTRAKAIAVNDSALSGRTRDWDDLLDLLDAQQIDSVEQFSRQFPQVPEWEYPEVHAALEEFFRTGTRDMHVDSPGLDDWDSLLAEIENGEL